MAGRSKRNLTWVIAAPAILALIAGVFVPQSAAAATSVGATTSRVLVQPSTTTTLSTLLTGPNALTISGFGTSPATDLVRVELTETGGGTIKFASTTGLSAVVGGSPIDANAYNSLAFTASVTDANNALAGLQYVSGTGFEVASVNIVVSYAGTVGDLYAFYGAKEHFYKFVPTVVTWSQAKAAAALVNFNGMTGYLATSTDSFEDDFIRNRVGGSAAWLAGTRGPGDTANYYWSWATGPASELGKKFFLQAGAGGANFTGEGFDYSNWAGGEPNGNTVSQENSLQITSGSAGKWNDLVDGDSQKIGYVIEFGGMGETVTKPSTARTITVDVTYPESKATNGNCVQNISNVTGVTVLDPFGDGSKCIVKFSNTGTTIWRAPAGVSAVEALVVAGGGGGGAFVGGGGGAGGVILKTGASAVSVSAGTGYEVTVGAGGAAATRVVATSTNVDSSNGQNSAFNALTAIGGGGGASYEFDAHVGGSGGGGSGYVGIGPAGAAGTSTQGNAGGSGHSTAPISQTNHHPAGGGGGAGQVGASVSGSQAGKGGDGISTDISGTTSFYGGGGGGGSHGSADPWNQGTVGAGGNGGGGSGAGANRTNYGIAMTKNVTGQSGAANTGGGGGGAGAPLWVDYASTGGAGGSGIVILSYSGTGQPTITTHPADARKVPNESAVFSVVATSPDSGTISYQWQEYTTAITATWVDISSATAATYTKPVGANVALNGYKYRVVVTNTVGSSSKSVASNAATLSVSNLGVVNANFNELNFDYTATKYVNLKKLNIDGTDATQAGTTVSATDSTGKNIGDRVLFKNVITINGVTVDAIVTTRKVVSATIKNYEAGATAGGANTNFQTDIDILAANGYGEFKFDFYKTDANIVANCNASISCSGTTKVILENINVSLIDIDYYQWNEITGLDSYTVSNPTNLKECLISSLTSSTTCTARVAQNAVTFPAALRFQGPSGIDSTLPQDMAIANYGSIETFSLKFGRDRSGTPNYYGVAFKALPWGSAAPLTNGPTTTYTITYSGNLNTAGTATTTHVGAVGSNFTTAANTGGLVRAGYTFSGWNTAANGSGTTYAVGSNVLMPKDGFVLYASWVPNALTLTYSANGGTGSPASESRVAGSVANVSSTLPTRDGFSFGGWRRLADCTCSVISSGGSFTMPASNTTLYAYWIEATGTIAYLGNSNTSGAVPTGSTGTSGTTYSVVGNTGSLVKSYYTFAGWNALANGLGTDYAAGASVSYPASGQTLNLYAQWTPVLYGLSYNANGGALAPATQNAVQGASVTLAGSNPAPTRSGYAFAGWNTSASGGGGNTAAGGSFTMPGANTVLYAQWTANPYSVTYLINAPVSSTSSGTKADAGTYTLGQTVTVGDQGTFAVDTYRFVGWNTLANGLGTDYVAAQTLSMPLNGITLHAKWVLATIKLTYNANGGSGAPGAETRVATTPITLPTDLPTRPGYTFAGWCADLSSCPSPLQRGGAYTVPSVDTVLYAKWTAVPYTLSYDANGGSGAPALTTSNAGLDVVVSATVPNRTGYSFLGWNTLIEATGTDYAAGANFRMGAANSVLYASWQANPFTLTYNGNGGSTLNPALQTRTAGSVSALSATVPTRTGYTFSGWNTLANGNGTVYAAGAMLTMAASNITLYAQWTIVNQGVSYNANNGSGAPTGSNYTFGDVITVSNVEPTRVGYVFTGWNTAADGLQTPYLAGETFSMPGTPVVLYAQWTKATYVVEYDANGGSGAPGAANYIFGNTADVSSIVPTRAGYDFQGWNTDAIGTGTARAKGSSFTMPASNVLLFAQWSLATYTVYYNANGGLGSINPQPGRFGVTVNLSSSSPSRTGYSFAGWNTSPDGSGVDYTSGGTLTIPNANVTLYAKWTPLTYTLTYAANGGSGEPAVRASLTMAQTFSLSTDVPTRVGYWFNGWNTQALGGGLAFASGASYTMGAGNATLFAVWVANDYEVTYNANGGSNAPVSQSTTLGSVTVSTNQPTRPGYTFANWNTLASGLGTTKAGNSAFVPGGNAVLYAIWTPNPITVTYNINSGTGDTPAPQQAAFESDPIQLAGTGAFSKENSLFQSWNTVADGSGTTYAADYPNFRVPSTNITLYAIWSAPYFAVEYNTNGGTTAPADQFAAPTEVVVLTTAKPSKEDLVFSNWIDVSTGTTYNAGSTITMPSSNVNLVANYIRRASVPGGNFVFEEPTTKPSTGGGKSTASGTKVTTITPTVTNAASQCLEDPIDGKCKAVVVIKGKGTWTLTNGVAKFVPVKGFVGKSIVVHRVTNKDGLVAKANLEAIYTKRPPVTITIGNFIDGSPRITALIGSKIGAFIKRYADYRTIECIGYTEGPTVLKTDKALSKQRATNACGYVRTTLKKKFVQLAPKAGQDTVEASENRRITITLRD